ncbi:hypothetical protein ACSBPH_08375 [Microbacterium sp. F51-2R]|uniref:hypothetical protein n=1 Tax=Microbacterium sp. F51-2R TaxID=3445777 RepID=UPI003FA114FA
MSGSESQVARLADGDQDAVVRPRMLARFTLIGIALALALAGSIFLVRVIWSPDLSGVFSWLTAAGWGWIGAPFAALGAMPQGAAVAGFSILCFCALIAGLPGMLLSFDVRTQSAQVPGRTLLTDQARLDQEIASMSVSFLQARFFAQCLAEPADRFVRITESVESGTRTIRDTISFTVSTRRLPDGSYVVPVLLCSRGRLENGLRFHGKGGERASSLTHLQATAFSLLAVRELIRAAGGLALALYESGGDESLQSKVRALLCANSDGDVELYKSILALDTRKERSRLLDAAAAIVFVLAQQYPICTAVDVVNPRAAEEPLKAAGWTWRRRRTAVRPLPEQNSVAPHIRIGVDRIVVPTLKRYSANPPGALARIERFRRDVIHLARVLLGVSPHSIDHPTTQAARTSAYHLAVRGSEGTYLAQQELRRAINGGSLTRAQHRSLQYAMYPRRGQRTAHLYVRHPTNTDHRRDPALLGFDELSYACKFYERMPGSLATALVACASALIISATIAAAALYVPPASDAPVAEVSGLLQILLAFPFALTATSSFRRGGALWDGDLGARTVTAITVGVLVASLVISTIGPMLGSREVVVMLWTAILVVAGCTTIGSLFAWVTRAFTQARFTRRADPASWGTV